MRLSNLSPQRSRVTPIPPMPAITPSGIPIAETIKASQKTECLICRLVAPIEESKPNYLVLSLTDIENALYISDTEPSIIRRTNTTPILTRNPVILSYTE